MSTSERTELAEVAAPAPSISASSLEQVREILFGPQQRELTRHVARTDAHFAAEADGIRREATRRLDVLEAYVRKELEGLVAAVEAQRSAQAEGLESSTRETREAIRSLERRVAKLEESGARAQREVREQMLAQANAFIEEVRRARQELGAAIERELVVAWGEGLEPEAGPPPEEAGHREAA
jgi:flagellar biosynthesis/type III secretory pathway protein FliH